MAESTVLEDIETGKVERQCRYFKAKVLENHQASGQRTRLPMFGYSAIATKLHCTSMTALLQCNPLRINEFSDQLAHPPFEFIIDHFEPGTLTARGLIDGEVAATDSVFTPGDPAAIQVSIDSIGGQKSNQDVDLFFVYAKIVDAQGVIVPTASNRVTFELLVDGELIGENPVNAEASIATILFKGDIADIKVNALSDELDTGNLQ